MTDSVTGHATGRAEIDAGGATAEVELLTDGASGVLSLEIDAGAGDMNILLDADDASTLAERLEAGARRLREVDNQ